MILEVVWYSDHLNQIGVTLTSVDCLDYVDFNNEQIVILEITLLIEDSKNE